MVKKILHFNFILCDFERISFEKSTNWQYSFIHGVSPQKWHQSLEQLTKKKIKLFSAQYVKNLF